MKPNYRAIFTKEMGGVTIVGKVCVIEPHLTPRMNTTQRTELLQRWSVSGKDRYPNWVKKMKDDSESYSVNPRAGLGRIEEFLPY